jgi:hypothetical protein
MVKRKLLLNLKRQLREKSVENKLYDLIRMLISIVFLFLIIFFFPKSQGIKILSTEIYMRKRKGKRIALKRNKNNNSININKKPLGKQITA